MRMILSGLVLLALVLLGAPSASAAQNDCKYGFYKSLIEIECKDHTEPKPPDNWFKKDNPRGDRRGRDGGGSKPDPDDDGDVRGFFCIPDVYAQLDPGTDSLIPDPSCPPSGEVPPDAWSRDEIERMVRTLVGRLRVPPPTPEVGPDPSWNEWGMAVVGHPVWLWSEVPRDVGTSVSGGGLTITIRAHLDSISYEMGDGNTVTCRVWTPYVRGVVTPGAVSPTCGHVYGWPSLPDRVYSVRATGNWTASWTAVGFSGTVPMRSTAIRDLPVGEIHALVKP